MADVVTEVETALYNRMLKNAFTGFLKSVAVAGVIGAVAGAALFGSGLLTANLIPGGIAAAFPGAWLAGAVTGALALMAPAGGFGAAAGIQSTRDARRFLVSHEADANSLMPPSLDAPKEALLSAAPHMAANKPDSHLCCGQVTTNAAAPHGISNAP